VDAKAEDSPSLIQLSSSSSSSSSSSAFFVTEGQEPSRKQRRLAPCRQFLLL